ncbi:SIMPL domain-containing protein [Sphingomonas solaris]|nr:SIMPL domain-containing protein [Sphingomonas solaris]
MKRRSLMLLVAASLPAVLATQGAVAQTVVASPVSVIQGTRLDVVAEGEVVRVPDIATIGAGVVTQAPTAAAAMAENATRMAATVAALRRAGVADRDIQTSAINLAPQYRYGENVPPVITGYQASNQVSVRFRDVKRSGAILDTLVAQGANQINGPSLSVDKAEAALDQARTAAIATARARAELYAKAAGLSVKRIVSISEQGSSAPSPQPILMMAMKRGNAAADSAVEPGEQRLSVSVSVTFELQ